MIVTTSSAPPSTTITPQNNLSRSSGDACSQQACTEQHPPETWWQRWTGDPVAIATVLLFLATCGLWFTTFKLWKTTAKIAQDTLEDAKIQADKMERSAKAMERVASSMEINADKIVESVGYQETFGQMQMRAYVSVILDGLYQDDTHVFEARPVLHNTGHTPAHGLKWRIRADILPVPLPDDFDFPLPDEAPGEGILNPQQTGFMSAYLDAEKFPKARVPEAELDGIKRATDRGFYTWGIVNYRDAFGVERYTKFAHLLIWYPRPKEKGKPQPADEGHGRYLPRHNEAN